MSFLNFLGLGDPGYGNVAKGILYAIYEIFWKIAKAAGTLIDVVVGVFYKLAGINYLGSGEGSLVEEQDLLTKFFNQNIISSLSLFMILVAILLMGVFGTVAILKQNYFSKEGAKSTTGVIKNMVLAFIFLICITPLSLFFISSTTTIVNAIVGIFGDVTGISLADMIFNTSFNGDPVSAYNTIYETDITHWTGMTNNLLFELDYPSSGSSEVTFYWYIFLIGGGVILFNVLIMAFKLVKRIFNVLILYLMAPIYISKMVSDDGVKFREWKDKILFEVISVVGTVLSFMILLSLVSVIDGIELITVGAASSGGESGGFTEIGIRALAAGEGGAESEKSETINLINNFAKILLLMAGTAVAKDSGSLLGNAFKSANEEGNLLEGIFNKLSIKETNNNAQAQAAPRARVITKNVSSSRKIINYDADVPLQEKTREIRNVNNSRLNITQHSTNIDKSVNNIKNKADIVMDSKNGHGNNGKIGNSRLDNTNDRGERIGPASIVENELKRNMNDFRQENEGIRKEWAFLKNNNSKESKDVTNDFESASKSFDTAIGSNDSRKIKDSMTMYVDAYKKEEKVAKEGYRDFVGKSTKLSNDLSIRQQEELRKVSTAYRKAQIDYSKTAKKLKEVSVGNMSAVDALRIKEKADKQREKLMEASTKANDFYNSQKRGG